MIKNAIHAHDRGKQRLNLSPKSIDSIQKAVDHMWFSGGYKKLPQEYYYSNIRDPRKQMLGYAAFKKVNKLGRRPRLVLTTILKSGMKPRGTDISHFFDHTVKDEGVKLDLPPKFEKLPKIPNNVAH
jgi:hypothetical protein